MKEKHDRAANRERAAAGSQTNLTLRSTLHELREASALLRLQAANQALANRRLLREIRRALKSRPR
jgi:ribosomal protein L29